MTQVVGYICDTDGLIYVCGTGGWRYVCGTGGWIYVVTQVVGYMLWHRWL